MAALKLIEKFMPGGGHKEHDGHHGRHGGYEGGGGGYRYIGDGGGHGGWGWNDGWGWYPYLASTYWYLDGDDINKACTSNSDCKTNFCSISGFCQYKF